jgi:hypothetical protein
MFFGARLTFERNPTFIGEFTISVWQDAKRLYRVYADIPQDVLDAIYRQGGLINPETGSIDKPFNDAILQWCVRETEERIRDGQFDEKPHNIIAIQVTAADIPSIMFFRREKSCDYQRLIGREVFCSAASPEDKSVTFQEGPVRLAPTTRQLCRGCDLPATELVCVHLAHPTVNPRPNLLSGVAIQRFMASGYCELGKNMNDYGANCRAGGNDCWERKIEADLDVASVPYSPLELPIAFDFLNVIWERFCKRALFTKASFQKPAALSLPCRSRDEFVVRIGDLNELLRKMDVPDELMPDDNKCSGKQPIQEREKLNRLLACLRGKLSSDEHEQVTRAVDSLKAINVVRNKITHGGAELLDALRSLGIKYPISDYSQSWDRIRSKAAEALTLIRSSLETLG